MTRRFLSFACFGLLPVMGFVIAGVLFPHLEQFALFSIACAITGVCLFGLGAFKARFHDKRYLHSGVETVLLGGTCAAVAYFVGAAVANSVGASELFLRPDMADFGAEAADGI
jgi:VIT1/CCC1 family predicted Fe2+/Mn2+ transporter